MLSVLRRHLPLGSRADAVELLDSGRLSPREVEENLADLARLNRLPGGTSASIAAISRRVDVPDARILDVGTGAGDMPTAFGERGWVTVAADTNPNVLEVARRRTAGDPRVELVEADGRALPFADDAFDVAHCSLLLHHLEPEEATTVLAELGRVARHGVVVNDLRRGLVPLLATALSVAAFARSRVTRNDGLISARRSYSLDELDRFLADAGLAVLWRSPSWMPRVVTAMVAR